MELNLAVSSVRITTCREQPPSVEGVQLRETRSSYFLNVQLQGLRKEDLQLEMDKDRCLVIRGEKYLQDMMGTLRWKWRVVESGAPTKPFKIPEDVNVGGIRVSFERGLLHISMPKLTRNTFAPYHVFHIHSSHLPHRPHHHQPNRQQQEEEAANNMADHKLATISEEAEMKMEPLSPGHPDEEEEGDKMSAEVPTRECTAPPSLNSLQSVDDSVKKEECVSQTENQHEDVMQERVGDAEERIGKGVEGEESPHAADAEAKQRAVVQEEKKGYYEKMKGERDIMGNGYVESEISERPKPFLCEGISQMFSAIAAIAHRKRRRG